MSDAAHVSQLLLKHRHSLLAFIHGLLADPHAAEDLFQEVSLVVVQKAGEFEEGTNFPAWARSILRNKVPGFSQIHYWLALERLGLGLGTEHVGPHEWYADGAEFLLSHQRADGSWKVEQGDFMGREVGEVLDTCLAVLFLRRVPFSREEQW